MAEKEDSKVKKSFTKELETIEKEIEQRRKHVLDVISQKENVRTFRGSSLPAKNINLSINEERESIKNKGLAQDITLKRITLVALFIFLAVETLLIFGFTFLQATFIWSFYLEEWSFKLLIVSTITQITFMLNIAVKHLFPNKN